MGNNFYNSFERTEPDLRSEMTRFLDGGYPEISKKQKAVLRKMRRNTEGGIIQCNCIDKVSKEPDLDTWCPYCGNEGFLWDEIFFDTYKIILSGDTSNALSQRVIEQGIVDIPLVDFYTEYDVEITEQDKIVELILGTNGEPIRPYKRRAIYRIGTAIDFRSDYGRLEYWKLTCMLEKRKFLNGP